jgi:polyhydroxyalkanoate synthesis regulator phasin
MENNAIFNVIQQSFRMAVGATASIVETLQDSQKRSQVLSDFSTEWQQKSEEWAQKGTITEQEARKIIEQFFKGYHSNNKNSYNDIEVKSVDNQSNDIQELTREIIALREEVQKLNV